MTRAAFATAPSREVARAASVAAAARTRRHDAAFEREADRHAERVSSASGNVYAPAAIAAARRRNVTALPPVRESSGAAIVPPLVRQVTASSGQALDGPMRALFEPHFGRDFGQVRIHTDARAKHSARLLDARAYTLGRHIVIGADAPAADSTDRRRLIAHELAHVVQQADGVAAGVQRKPLGGGLFPPTSTNYRFDTGRITADDLSDPDIAARLNTMTRSQLRAYRQRVSDEAVRDFIDRLLMPQPTAQLETDIATLTPKRMDEIAAASYWEQRTIAAFDVASWPGRMVGDAEEQDAVLSALWQTFPLGRSTPPASKSIVVPASAQRPNALLYRFDVRAAATVGGKPRLDVAFERERAGSIAEPAVEPPKGYIAPVLQFNSDVGFAESADEYFRTHRDERRQIAYWIKQQSGSFEQMVVTKGTPKRGGAQVETLFLVMGEKAKSGALTQLHIELRPGGRPTEVEPPADYRDRDYADFLLDEARTKPHATKGDLLGDVLLTGVPPDEATSVKYAVVRQFVDIGTRDAEADVLVPIGGTNKEVYYTLRFRSPDNEVDVERVGEKGASAKLDPTRMDIARVRGYDANAADPAKLKSWLGRRYQGLKPGGTTVDELRASANQSMSAQAGAAAWYQNNYKVTVLDGAATQSRLRSAHRATPAQTPDTDNKDFTPDELKLTELSLQTLTDKMLSLLQYVRLGRKKTLRKADGTEAGNVGQAFWNGSNRTMVMHDSAYSGRASAFRGGAEAVNAPEAMFITHEIGHLMEPKTVETDPKTGRKVSAKAEFDKFVAKSGIRPFTRYAESKPGSEFFTETFAIYQTDPEWLGRNHPAVFAWMDEFNRTGKAPR